MFGRIAVIVMFFGFAAGTSARADNDEMKKAAKAQAEKAQTAVMKGDAETLIDLTHPKLVEQLGGRDKAITATRSGVKMYKDKGLEIKAAKVGDPSDPVQGGKELYIVVPTTTEMTTPQGKAVSQGYMVGVSADGGKMWRFVHGALDAEKVRKLLPDIPEKLVLPKRDVKIIKD